MSDDLLLHPLSADINKGQGHALPTKNVRLQVTPL